MKKLTIAAIILLALLQIILMSCQKENVMSESINTAGELAKARISKTKIDKQTNLDEAVQFETYNSCRDEFIYITGERKSTYRLSQSNGGYFLDYTVIMNLSGVGGSGLQYHGSFIVVDRTQLTRIDSLGYGYHLTGQIAEHLILNAPGGVSIKVRVIVHITYDADNNIQIGFDRETESCI